MNKLFEQVGGNQFRLLKEADANRNQSSIQEFFAKLQFQSKIVSIKPSRTDSYVLFELDNGTILVCYMDHSHLVQLVKTPAENEPKVGSDVSFSGPKQILTMEKIHISVANIRVGESGSHYVLHIDNPNNIFRKISVFAKAP